MVNHLLDEKRKGHDMNEEMKRCQECGHQQPANVLSCNCGQDPLQVKTSEQEARSPLQIPGSVLWILSAVIAIIIVGLFTHGGIGVVVYAITEWRFTSGPYVTTAITTLIVRFGLFILVGAIGAKR